MLVFVDEPDAPVGMREDVVDAADSVVVLVVLVLGLKAALVDGAAVSGGAGRIRGSPRRTGSTGWWWSPRHDTDPFASWLPGHSVCID